MTLPKGQYDIGYMPRFGLPQYTDRFPTEVKNPTLDIGGKVKQQSFTQHLQDLPRTKQVSDFHCVTSWSCTGLHWEGVRFRDLYEQLILPLAKPDPDATNVVFKCQDGYRARMNLDDLLADDVMLADRLDGKPLTIENGAPHRLIVPAHYGYKNAKHVNAIEFHRPGEGFKPPRLRILEHPRARVAYEERGTGAPGWVLRYVFKPLINSTIKSFDRAMQEYRKGGP